MSKKIEENAAERIKRLLDTKNANEAYAKKIEAKRRPFRTASSDAQSIKGKVVDDSEIGHRKALIYDINKDKIVYGRVGGGGGGGGGSGNATSILGIDVDDSGIGDTKVLTYNAGTGKLEYSTPAGAGDMLKADYDVDSNNVVDNSQKLEGFTLAQVRTHAPAAHTHPVADLTDHNAANHDSLNINADRLDGIHASGFLQGTWASGICNLAKGVGTPHGMGGTPTRVFPSANAPQPYAIGWTADNTNIYFWHNAAATLIINWLARL